MFKENTFKKGDKVVCITKNDPTLKVGAVIVVMSVMGDPEYDAKGFLNPQYGFVGIDKITGEKDWYMSNDFKLVKAKKKSIKKVIKKTTKKVVKKK